MPQLNSECIFSWDQRSIWLGNSLLQFDFDCVNKNENMMYLMCLYVTAHSYEHSIWHLCQHSNWHLHPVFLFSFALFKVKKLSRFQSCQIFHTRFQTFSSSFSLILFILFYLFFRRVLHSFPWTSLILHFLLTIIIEPLHLW